MQDVKHATNETLNKTEGGKKLISNKAPCQHNLIPKGNDGQIVQHNDHKWSSVLHEKAWQSDDVIK